MKYTVLDIEISGSDMYIGGLFRNTNGNARADYIVRWDGTSYSALGGGTNGALNESVEAMAMYGGYLYVGGAFTNAGGKAKADYLAKWDGTSWSAVGANGTGPALNDRVVSLAVMGTDLYVGGYFQDAGGVAEADSLARWNGTWSAVGAGGDNEPAIRDGVVHTLLVSGSDLYVGGSFTDAGYNVDADQVARWDGAVWHSLGTGGRDAMQPWEGVFAIAVDGADVYVGGTFRDWAGDPKADALARWDGVTWHSMGSSASGTDGAIFGIVYDLAMLNGDLYVGGAYQDLAGIAAADYLAIWDGGAWSAPSSYAGNGALPDNNHAQSANTLYVDGAALLVGGNFYDAFGDPTADWLVRFRPNTSNFRPDARIRKGTGTLVGNDVYNATAVGQTRTGSAAAGATVKFDISLQNDGLTADQLKVAASAATSAGYTVKYFRGTTDITSAVVAGTYTTASVSPGNAVVITAKVAIGAGAAAGSSVMRLVTVTSVGDPALSDTVKFVAKRV